MTKVCHITSVHPKEDIRIFQKECRSLARAGYDVTLVQQGGSDEKEGVHIVGFGEISSSRLRRMLHTARAAYQAGLTVDADLYHLHDPELLPYGMKLKRAGKKVIYDSHEDVPAEILEKYWLPGTLRKAVAWAYGRYEAHCFARLDGVLGITPSLCERLERQARRTEMITNYPIWEPELPRPAFSARKVVFPGLISSLWNLHVLIEAIGRLGDVTLELRSGNVEQPYCDELRRLPDWERVNFPGRASHEEVLALMAESMCGVALARPCPNTAWKRGTLGNTKIFEYMMAGIPVVCTDFTLWKEIVEGCGCGICVNPESVDEVAEAISYLVDHPEEARRMGENGRRAVRDRFNWGVEEQKLLAFFQAVLG